MQNGTVNHLKTISDYHRFCGLPKPGHPLVSVINFEAIPQLSADNSISLVIEFYAIALKRNFTGRLKYGQQSYDFDEGLMIFLSPGQLLRIEHDSDETPRHSGWLLLVHPDFLWGTTLANGIKAYDYFGYSVTEALFLSAREEEIITGILQNIEREYLSTIDQFSQPIIIPQIEVLLNYAERFYHRQFITRKKSNHTILARLEDVLTTCFQKETLAAKGLPTVQAIADELHLSANYLSGLLKVLTGRNTQQLIHEKLIEKAKERLSTTPLSIGEVAYELGFEHSQSFSRFFKSKTNLSPLEFRQSFN